MAWRSRGRATTNRSRGGGVGGGTRRMDLIASVSRSSGLEKDGDALKNFKTQEEYRGYIQEKLDGFWRKHPSGAPETDKEILSRRQTQENLLILFRKLREGLVSSKRRDQFAIEVYETSFHLAILFESPRQTTAIMSHLIPDLYSTTPTPSRYATTLVSLLHHLVAAYPSQGTFRQHLASLPKTLLPLESRSHKWIVSLALSLRSLNYSKFEEVTRHSSYTAFFEFQPTRNNTPVNSPTSGSKPPTASLFSTDDLPREAAHILVDALRTKAREKTWQIICSAYRELSCNPESRDTRDWLERSLTLSPGNSAVVDLDSWLEKKSEEGQVKKKDGAAQGRWIVCKTR